MTSAGRELSIIGSCAATIVGQVFRLNVAPDEYTFPTAVAGHPGFVAETTRWSYFAAASANSSANNVGTESPTSNTVFVTGASPVCATRLACPPAWDTATAPTAIRLA